MITVETQARHFKVFNGTAVEIAEHTHVRECCIVNFNAGQRKAVAVKGSAIACAETGTHLNKISVSRYKLRSRTGPYIRSVTERYIICQLGIIGNADTRVYLLGKPEKLTVI